MQQWRNLPLVTGYQPCIGRLVVIRTTIFHSIALAESFHLPVSEHRQTWQRSHQRAHAEVLVAFPKLVHRCALVGIIHEVHVALENLGIEFDGVLDYVSVVRVLLVAQHVHEGAVVYAMHPERAHEISFEEPKGFGQKQRAGSLRSTAIDHLAPEFVGDGGIELGLGEPVLGTRRDRPAGSRGWIPQALIVLLGERHGRVKANHG